jgi:serine/threonine-protein kinase HipA
MRIARDAGLDVAVVDVIEVGERDVLVVERFDREIADGVTHRLHQEDACQALGIDPRDRHKYQQRNGGPSYGQIAKLLVTHAVDRDKELRALSEAMVLTCAIGNTDAHGKNHSFLIDGDTLSFAPIYDASPTVSFVTGRQLAMYVGGSITIGEVNRMQLALEAKSWGLSRGVATDLIDDVLLRLGRAIEEADESGVLKAMTDDVEHYSSRLVATCPLPVE